MGTVAILETTTRKPITLIGERAGICWGSDTSDLDKNYKRGWDCVISGHGRLLEFVDVEMMLDGYSARVIREWYTHIGGAPTRLQASTRYINYGNFNYIIPDNIMCDVYLKTAYVTCMENIASTLQELEEWGVPREDAAMLLPLGMTTRIVDKRNLRNLIDMSHQRMCNRAYWEFRKLFTDICNALRAYDLEWQCVVDNFFKPKCDVMGYCTEKDSCGRQPKLGGAK